MNKHHQQQKQQAPQARPPTQEPAPAMVAVGLGHMRSGEFAAVAVEVRGAEVVSRTLLAVSPSVDGPVERALSNGMFRRLWLAQPFSALEQRSNARDSGKHRPEDVAHLSALALLPHGRGFVAISLEVEGACVVERLALSEAAGARVDKFTAWDMLERHRDRHLLNEARRLEAKR